MPTDVRAGNSGEENTEPPPPKTGRDDVVTPRSYDPKIEDPPIEPKGEGSREQPVKPKPKK